MSVDVSNIVEAVIDHSPADGIAVGTVQGDTHEFVQRHLAGVPVDPDTVMYGASVTNQMVTFLLAREEREHDSCWALRADQRRTDR